TPRYACLSKTPGFAPLCAKALNRPTSANSSRKKKWTPAWSRCCAPKECVSAGRLPPSRTYSRSAITSKTAIPTTGKPTIRKLYEVIRSLKDSPNRGRIGRVAGTRELLFLPLPYIAVYRTQVESIEILRIYHTAQDRA